MFDFQNGAEGDWADAL